MGKITKIETQKKNKERVSIFIDGEFKTGMDLFVSLKYRLSEGREIGDEELLEIVTESDNQKALDSALKMVARKLCTEKQVRDKLKEKDFAASAIKHAVEKLYEYKYLNDFSYAESFISFHKREWGVLRLKNELRLDGVDKDIIDEVLENLRNDGGQTEEVLNAARKYVRQKKEFNRPKVYNYLLSKGFLSEDISPALKILKSEIDELEAEESEDGE